MRAAIYARMSTDKESDTSPEDQVARCREYAGGQGWAVVGASWSRRRGSPARAATTAPDFSG